MEVPSAITCVECGGVASLIGYLPPDEDPEPGTAFAYRCADCMERFDVVIDEDETDAQGDQQTG
jgi:hypothetical protein